MDGIEKFIITLGICLGTIFGLIGGSAIQYYTTLKEVKPFLELKCDTAYNKMTKEQIKFCEYYRESE
jgi:hypothetical protein